MGAIFYQKQSFPVTEMNSFVLSDWKSEVVYQQKKVILAYILIFQCSKIGLKIICDVIVFAVYRVIP